AERSRVNRRHADVVLVGDLGVLRAAARAREIDPNRLICLRNATVDEAPRLIDELLAVTKQQQKILVYEPTAPLAASDRKPGHPTRAGGAAQLAWINAATDLVSHSSSSTSSRAYALVTGPVSKDAIARSGVRGARSFRGHTEHLAARLHAKEVTMAFWT